MMSPVTTIDTKYEKVQMEGCDIVLQNVRSVAQKVIESISFN